MPINDEINANKVRLIGSKGEQIGILSLGEALDKAKESSLELVQMAKEGDPVVCKLMDHGKHIFDSKKQKSASRKKQKRILIKEIKFRPVTEEYEYQNFPKADRASASLASALAYLTKILASVL